MYYIWHSHSFQRGDYSTAQPRLSDSSACLYLRCMMYDGGRGLVQLLMMVSVQYTTRSAASRCYEDFLYQSGRWIHKMIDR